MWMRTETASAIIMMHIAGLWMRMETAFVMTTVRIVRMWMRTETASVTIMLQELAVIITAQAIMEVVWSDKAEVLPCGANRR